MHVSARCSTDSGYFNEARKDPRLHAAWARYHAIGAALREEWHGACPELHERVRIAVQAGSSGQDMCNGPHVGDNPRCSCWWRRVMKLRAQWRP